MVRSQIRLRTLLAFGLLVAGCVLGPWHRSAPAQVRIGPQGVEPVETEEQPAETRELKRRRERDLTISGAAQPVPNLKYSFDVRVYQRRPGNAAQYYYRAFLMAEELTEEQNIKIAELLETPLSDLASTGAEKILSRHPGIFDAIDQAVHRSYCDWDLQVEHLTGLDFVSFLLPELQEARSIARLLALKARWHISRGEFLEASAILRAGYILGRDVARVPTLVNGLVGIAIHGVMNVVVVDWINHAGSPNLYWALSELSRPPISLREAMNNELNVAHRMFPILDQADAADLTPAQWDAELEQILRRLNELSGVLTDKTDNSAGRWALAGFVAMGYPRAKRQLMQRGMSEEELQRMPASRLVAIYQGRLSHEIADALYKWQLLPPHQATLADSELDGILQRLDPRRGGDQAEIFPIMSLLLPAVTAAREAETRGWADLNALQTVEAIRVHLADHGELPATLDEITAVPVPLNPATNRQFTYKREGDQATLTDQTPDQVWTLNLTLRRASD